MRKLYFAMVHSNLAYGINVYGSANKTNLGKLVVKQKQAIRTVCNVNYRDHTAPLFKKLKVLPLEKLIEFAKIKFMHNFHFKRLPLSFANTWMSNIEKNPERALRNANDLYIPPHRVEIVKRLPLFLFPEAWNSAPGNKLNPRQHSFVQYIVAAVMITLSGCGCNIRREFKTVL
jgi:hypothetical protein